MAELAAKSPTKAL